MPSERWVRAERCVVLNRKGLTGKVTLLKDIKELVPDDFNNLLSQII